MRVVGDGYLSGRVGVIVDAPTAPDANRPIIETAWATVRFDGEIPSNWRCDPEILEPVE